MKVTIKEAMKQISILDKDIEKLLVLNAENLRSFI